MTILMQNEIFNEFQVAQHLIIKGISASLADMSRAGKQSTKHGYCSGINTQFV